MSKGTGVIAHTVLATAVAVGCWAGTAKAVLNYTGGNGIVSFGVASYGGGPVANPVYIPNNFTLLNDVLESPGHGFQTANTTIVNNIASWGGALPGGAFQIGGGNGNGNFGTGVVVINGPGVGFALTDANPDASGAASYEIGSWNASYTNVGALATTYGNVLGIHGHLNTPGAAMAVALRTHVVDSAGVWGAGFDLPQLVLAAAGNFNGQALGGLNGLSAGVFIDAFGNFTGLAFNNLGPVVIPNGDVITVTSTLTAIGDPMDCDVFFDLSDSPLFLDQLLNPNGANSFPHSTDGTPMLPSTSFDTLIPSPEPTTLGVLALGTMLVVGRRRRV